ncbi:MAG: hypothetical protein AAF399_28090 [Bacteroidota bacterium]
MKPSYLCYLLISASCWACQPKDALQQAPPLPDGPFFQSVPTDTPTLLGAGRISSVLTEYNGTFPPDGTTFFYTSEVAGKGHIVFSHMQEDGHWSQPAIAPFSGTYSEYDPIFSPDGSRLYFSSERPIPGQDQPSGTHIWWVEPSADGWSEPTFVPLGLDGAYYSSWTKDGRLFFNTWNTGDIRMATPSDTGFVVETLPPSINGKSDVGDPFVSPEGDYLIFRGYFREGLGRGDLYISFAEEQGGWGEPINLGAPINSSAHEMCPYVTVDGKLFVFASDRLQENYPNQPLEALQETSRSWDNRNQKIYTMGTDFIEQLRASQP